MAVSLRAEDIRNWYDSLCLWVPPYDHLYSYSVGEDAKVIKVRRLLSAWAIEYPTASLFGKLWVLLRWPYVLEAGVGAIERERFVHHVRCAFGGLEGADDFLLTGDDFVDIDAESGTQRCWLLLRKWKPMLNLLIQHNPQLLLAIYLNSHLMLLVNDDVLHSLRSELVVQAHILHRRGRYSKAAVKYYEAAREYPAALCQIGILILGSRSSREIMETWLAESSDGREEFATDDFKRRAADFNCNWDENPEQKIVVELIEKFIRRQVDIMDDEVLYAVSQGIAADHRSLGIRLVCDAGLACFNDVTIFWPLIFSRRHAGSNLLVAWRGWSEALSHEVPGIAKMLRDFYILYGRALLSTLRRKYADIDLEFAGELWNAVLDLRFGIVEARLLVIEFLNIGMRIEDEDRVSEDLLQVCIDFHERVPNPNEDECESLHRVLQCKGASLDIDKLVELYEYLLRNTSSAYEKRHELRLELASALNCRGGDGLRPLALVRQVIEDVDMASIQGIQLNWQAVRILRRCYKKCVSFGVLECYLQGIRDSFRDEEYLNVALQQFRKDVAQCDDGYEDAGGRTVKRFIRELIVQLIDGLDDGEGFVAWRFLYGLAVIAESSSLQARCFSSLILSTSEEMLECINLVTDKFDFTEKLNLLLWCLGSNVDLQGKELETLMRFTCIWLSREGDQNVLREVFGREGYFRRAGIFFTHIYSSFGGGQVRLARIRENWDEDGRIQRWIAPASRI